MYPGRQRCTWPHTYTHRLFVFNVVVCIGAVFLFVAVDPCHGSPLDLIGFNGTFQLVNDDSNRDCQWQIHGNVGFKVMVELVVIQNNKNGIDFVTFRDGDSSGPIITRLFESEEMKSVVSCSNSLFVRHSNVYGASKLTFSASFKSIGKW